MEILDSDLLSTSERSRIIFFSTKIYSILISSITIVNFALSYLITLNSIDVHKIVAIVTAFITIYIVGPFTSLLLAVLFALLPYKQRTYSKKYFPMSLFIYLVLNAPLLLALLLTLYEMPIEKLKY